MCQSNQHLSCRESSTWPLLCPLAKQKFLALSKKAKKERLFISLPILLLQLRYIYGLFFQLFRIIFCVCVSLSLSICTDSYNKWYLDKNLRVNLFDYENEITKMIMNWTTDKLYIQGDPTRFGWKLSKLQIREIWKLVKKFVKLKGDLNCLDIM